MTQEEFMKYLINEVKQVAQQEGIAASDSDVAEILKNLQSKLSKSNISELSDQEKELLPTIELTDIKVLSKSDLNESFSLVKSEENPTTEEVLESVKEVKQLNEEFKRWKQLIDFRSPLLNKENQ